MPELAPEPLRHALRDRYTVQHPLGRGGTAFVFLAHDLKHDRPVALKVLRPEIAVLLGAERFLREIQLAAKLQHPHILPLYESGEANGWLYYVMPPVEGESLRQRLEREGPVPLDDALRIAGEVCDALGYAHSQGIVHRDIKPENILLERGHARVADFGLARAITAAGGEKLSETGIAVGTPTYMSPEQATADTRIDGRSDLYSLGCVLYEMLAGQPPFTGSTSQAVLARHALDPVPPLRTVRQAVPEHIERIVMRALEKVPADRFPTASEFGEALASAPRAAERRRALSKRATAWITVGALLLSAAGWFAVKGWNTEAPAIRRIAVLPLANLTGDSAQDFFVDGMHEALITELAQIEALTVISRTSVLRYRQTEQTVPEIARELGVDAIVEGSVLRAGDSVRITTQLIDGRTEGHLWAESHVRDLRDVLRLYGEVATGIAEQIHIAVTPAERGRLTNTRRVDPVAYDRALLGRHECWKWTQDGFMQGIRILQDAIGRDSTYAPAYAWLAMCYADQAFFTYARPADVNPKAKDAARRAIALDSTLAEAHAALGLVRFQADLDFDGPDRDFRRALDLSPNSAPILLQYGSYLTLTGRFDEALDLGKRAIALDPFSESTSLSLGWTYFKAKRYDESIAQLHRTLELMPGYWFAHLELGWSYVQKGMPEAAVAHCDSALVRAPQADDQVLFGTCGWVYGRAGRTRKAEAMLTRLNEIAGRRWLDPVYVAWVHVGLGRREDALQALRTAEQERSPSLVFLKVEPAFDPLRSHPDFRDLLRDLGIEPL